MTYRGSGEGGVGLGSESPALTQTHDIGSCKKPAMKVCPPNFDKTFTDLRRSYFTACKTNFLPQRASHSHPQGFFRETMQSKKGDQRPFPSRAK